MKFTFSLIILLLTLNISFLSGQNIRIITDCQSPRLNKEFKIRMEAPFIDQTLKKQLEPNFNFPRRLNSTYSYSTTIIPDKIGKYQIGPFEFKLNDKTYKSDSITINVLPELKAKESIYMSVSYQKGKTIVTIEQVYKPNKERTNNSFFFTQNLVEITSHSFSKMYCHMANSEETQLPESTVDNPYNYSIKTYRLTNNTKKTITLTRKNFKNLPDDFSLPTINVK